MNDLSQELDLLTIKLKGNKVEFIEGGVRMITKRGRMAPFLSATELDGFNLNKPYLA